MPTKSKTVARRQRRGSAWYWRQTDAWYYTDPDTKRRVPLRNEHGRILRGKDQKEAARLALARVQIRRGLQPTTSEESATAKSLLSVHDVCSEYLRYCEQAAAAGRMHAEYLRHQQRTLLRFCDYCGTLPAADLKRADVSQWVESVPHWRSPVTRRNVLTTLISAWRHAETEHGLPNPLQGLKKPGSRPRLHSINAADEETIYAQAAPAFRDFLFAALHTGLRPFCELARLAPEHVEQTSRGMLWRVHSSKTKKTRKIPVRPEVAQLVRQLLKFAPANSKSPIFRNPQGNPWKKVTGVKYFVHLKRKLGWLGADPRSRYSCYSCRHTFAHRMLSGYWNEGVGCSIEVLAELMGDTPKTAFDHYGKEWGHHYQDPLWAAIGESDVPSSRGRTSTRKHRAK